jgi:NADH-quinone oxidoreductase subunit E
MNEQRVDEIIDSYQADRTCTLAILQDVQAEYKYLPREAIIQTARRLEVTLGEVYRMATFFRAFSLEPKGEHTIKVCMGTACHVRGATRVLEKVQDLTGIKPGETDLELKFSLETVNCLGCCALGPVMEIDGKTHGKISPAKTPDVINSYD